MCLRYENISCGLFAAVEFEDGKKNEVKSKSLFGTHIREQRKREREKKRGKQNKAVQILCMCLMCVGGRKRCRRTILFEKCVQGRGGIYDIDKEREEKKKEWRNEEERNEN